MKAYETIRLERDKRGVAQLTLARPSRHNALDAAMIGELRNAAARLTADASVRVVVLTAEGTTFCAGADLTWMQEQALKDRDGRMASAREFASMLRDLNALPKPVIARVQGPAFGGGVGLMSVSDIVIASDKAQFALSETRLGMIPATIGPYVLRRIGEAAARRFILNSRTIDAAAARHIGLVSVIASEDALDRAIETEVNECLRCAPGAVADAKALLRHLACDPAAEQLAWTAERLADRWETDEAQEGIRCLLARQSPSWTRA